MSYDRIVEAVGRYYGEKIQAFGATARGVDWNSPESQRLRFSQLLKICERDLPFSLNDYGCGYGALVDFLRKGEYAFQYCGFDISPQMIARAKELHAGADGVTFIDQRSDLKDADYTLASGVFNVKLQTPTVDWQEYVLQQLNMIHSRSMKGFAFNMLTKYSDPEYMRSDLFYGDPLFFFDYCKMNFSRFVALIHDYPLYEFTVLVRKG